MKYVLLLSIFAVSTLMASMPFQVDSATHTIYIPCLHDLDQSEALIEKAIASLPPKSFASYRLPLGMTGYTSHEADGSIKTVYIDGEFGPWNPPTFDGFVEYDLICK